MPKQTAFHTSENNLTTKVVLDERADYTSEKALDGLNFEPESPLKIGVDYLLLPQQNIGKIYTVNKRDVVSKRFLALEMDGDEVVDVRTIGVSSLNAMYVKDVTGDDDEKAPTCDELETRDGYLRLKSGAIAWKHAIADHSFIGGDKASRRAFVRKPVIIRCTDVRVPVWVFEYNNTANGTPGGDIKLIPNLQPQTAICGKNKRFIKYANGPAPTPEQIKAGEEYMKIVKKELGIK